MRNKLAKFEFGAAIALSVPVTVGAFADNALPVPQGWRFYRFSVQETGGDALQFSELRLYSGTNDVTRRRAAVAYDRDTFAPEFADGYNPMKAVDGSLETKWYDDRAASGKRKDFGKNVWLVLEYEHPVPVTRYEWYTADDTSHYAWRNPTAWRLEASVDGKAWTELDAVEFAMPHSRNKALAYSQNLDGRCGLPANVVVHSVKDGKGRSLVEYEVDGTKVQKFIPQSAIPATAVKGNRDWPKLEEVIIATKCHLDVGYTATVPELVRKYRTRDMDAAKALFDSDKDKPPHLRSRWTLPAWMMDVVVTGDYSPERRAWIEDAVRRHRLMWHAMPFTFETEASDLEELVRMFSWSSALSRRFGQGLSRYAKQTDVPDQAWALPTVLANAGVKFLHMGINPGCKQKALLDKIPVLSWWEGPDGSRILLGFSHGYGWVDWGSLTPPKGWRHKTWLAYMMRSDNQGPISPKTAANILEQARRLLPGVKVRYGDPAEFADAVIAEEKAHPTLPVVRGDMPDTWIHGQMTAPQPTLLHRHAKSGLITLGVLDTTLRSFGIETGDVSGELAEGYRESCLYSEHTWGFACYRERMRFHAPDWRTRYERGEFNRIDASFDYHMQYARRAHGIAASGIDRRMASLARSVSADGPRVVAFNPLPWNRDAIVEVDMPEGFTVPGGVRTGGRVKFLAKDVPAGGYRTFKAVADASGQVAPAAESLPSALKTRYFTAKFDLEKGGVASLVENATGRELVRQGGHVLGQFLHERFSRNEVRRFMDAYTRAHQRSENSDFGKGGMPGPGKIPYAVMTPKAWKAVRTRTALGDEVSLVPSDTLGLAKGFEIRFSFPDSKPCVCISWRVAEKTPDPTPEGGWICLPFNVSTPSFRVGRIGGTIDPAKDIIFGANRNLMCVDRAITVRSGAEGAGVGVVSADLPLWSLGKPGLWRYEPDYVPTKPELFANLYNNQWNTNFPFWIPGSWTATVVVYPVAKGADEEAAMFTPSWEVRQPCVAAFSDGKGAAGASRAIPSVQGGVALSRKGVRVTAFCPNPDGPGTVLRVWEQSGKGGEISVTLPRGFKASIARPVNLRGEDAGARKRIEAGRFSFRLGAWAPASFVLE